MRWHALGRMQRPPIVPRDQIVLPPVIVTGVGGGEAAVDDFRRQGVARPFPALPAHGSSLRLARGQAPAGTHPATAGMTDGWAPTFVGESVVGGGGARVDGLMGIAALHPSYGRMRKKFYRGGRGGALRKRRLFILFLGGSPR